MISFDSFNIQSGVPIYTQILRHIKLGIVSGDVTDGDELSSRRALSALLGVNPNTVQKAYRQLEEEGLIRSHTGAKSYMLLDSSIVSSIRAQLVRDEAMAAVQSMKGMGISRQEALALIDDLWDRGNTP